MSHPIIALWSHPRSMSTAFERIMRSRGDFDCMHEPFMYEYYINRSKREMPHFDAMDEHPRSYDDIRGMILAKAEKAPVFFKDMSYYVVPRILDDGAFQEIGLEAQWRHAEAVQARKGRPPVIVRSEAVQSDPEGELRKYWRTLGLADKPHALHWNDPPPADWKQVQAWHGNVMESTAIRPSDPAQAARTEAEFVRLAKEHPRFRAYLAHHLPFYERLLQLAL